MAIEFTHLHNLVRTYQRSLHLHESSKASTPRMQPELADHVSISEEARDGYRQGEDVDADPTTDDAH